MARICTNCKRPLDQGDIRQRDPKTGGLVCSLCLAHPIAQPNKIDVTSSRQVTAHDGGDGRVVYHCPFCGSGGVIGRSDSTVECSVCETHFTVQVQPRNVNSPQTINGQPVHIPGMPEESVQTPSTAVPTTPAIEEGAAVPGGVPGFSDSDLEEYMTATGARLDRKAYVQHLAMGAAKDVSGVLKTVRLANRR